MTTSVGELFELFGDCIAIETAARKWRAGNRTRLFGTPDQMRFYTLTQYLHWLQCGFEPAGQIKTFRTLVNVHPRRCQCGRLFVAEKYRKTCQACGGRRP